MRKIRFIVIHCTATAQTASVEAIQRYWKTQLKWRNPGYHYIIDAKGEIIQLQPEELTTNGVAGHNAQSIHVSYIGGIDASGKPKDTRTLQQKAALIGMIKELKTRYADAQVLGHRDFEGVKKACPSFDARAEYAQFNSSIINQNQKQQ